MGFPLVAGAAADGLGAGNSPYSGSTLRATACLSAPSLYEEGSHREEEAGANRGEPYSWITILPVRTTRVLHLAFDRLNPALRKNEKFAKEEEYWLEDYALYGAVARGGEWWKWESGLARRESKALAEARKEPARWLLPFEQFVFFRQWRASRGCTRGVRVIGDLPFYVARTAWMSGCALRVRA